MRGLLIPDSIFAGYRIVRHLGGGGMADVYLAAHPRLPRFDAVKVLSAEYADDAEFRARFVRESQLVAGLRHPNLVAVRDCGIADGRLWLSMQFIEGYDGSRLIGKYPDGLPPEQAIHIVAEAAGGLDAAHRSGLLHRDVKPSNLLLEPRDEQPDRVYVADFGIARAGYGPQITAPGTVLGTFAYAAPEQIESAPLDHRVDVYALGCTLFELLTGRKPFTGTTPEQLAYAHLLKPPPLASSVNPALPPEIDNVLCAAMAKNPADRPNSCGELAQAARAAFTSTGRDGATSAIAPQARTTHRAERLRPFRTRTAIASLAASALCIITVAALTITLPGGHEAAKPPTTTIASSVTPTSTGTEKSGTPWGSHEFIVQAFPNLLPSTPFKGGNQQMMCIVYLGEATNQALPDNSSTILCEGNDAPLHMLMVTCDQNRTPIKSVIDAETDPVLGSTDWARGNANGSMFWGVSADGSTTYGWLEIRFADPAHKFCELEAQDITGNPQDLIDRWWPQVPL
ncbi:Serine/threonine-protein kinase PknD [Nocardia sp. RB20]|uniref:non-specific serine/threonine protein kinase n=2 Tax=Nocardia macrotermitis TaxID=2585198 RepID=A0A7K0D0Z7_9NOCA|nr:Serine/threonine-protein kinase PknD [Nocardia macrotermitis]